LDLEPTPRKADVTEFANPPVARLIPAAAPAATPPIPAAAPAAVVEKPPPLDDGAPPPEPTEPPKPPDPDPPDPLATVGVGSCALAQDDLE
jgi:hypothetical protein